MKEDILSKPAIRAAIRAKAAEKNVSVPKSAMDNFIDTYKTAKAGPIQRKIASFISGMDTKPAKTTTKPQANRAKSQGGRSFAQTGTTKAGSTLARTAKTKRDIAAKITAAEKGSKDPRGNQIKATPGAAKKKGAAKTWKDFKSVAAAQKAGLNYFMGRDGKKKIAITAEQLKKKNMGLTEYANMLRKKGKK